MSELVKSCQQFHTTYVGFPIHLQAKLYELGQLFKSTDLALVTGFSTPRKWLTTITSNATFKSYFVTLRERYIYSVNIKN